tara:strand:- start:48 stop:272 length:225 start_codon:yes stop_codon:yes gene_type:complete
MARYMLFKKTRKFDYKYLGSSEGRTGSLAINKFRARSRKISTKDIVIAIPSKTFMSYQLNPTKSLGFLAWKKPR